MSELKMKGNRIQITITLKPEVVEKLTKIATATGRTRSGLCGWLIAEGLKEKFSLLKL